MIPFHSDTTLRWACRSADYVFWAKFQGLFASSSGNEYKFADIWELRDGNFVTITNRYIDLPEWFDLHPSEVSGAAARWMIKRIEAGYKPSEPVDGPNIWRVFAGDRLAWVGPKRGGVESDNGMLGLVEFTENALVYGEPFDISGGSVTFGGFDGRQMSAEGARVCRAAWDAIKQAGIPRDSAVGGWRIG